MAPVSHDADDPLAWARDYMPVLGSFRAEYGESRPLDGYTVAFAWEGMTDEEWEHPDSSF